MTRRRFPEPPTDTPAFSSYETAEILGIKRGTLRALTYKGAIVPCKNLFVVPRRGVSVFYSRKAIADYLKKRKRMRPEDEPKGKKVYIAELVRWAKQHFAEKPVNRVAEKPDYLENTVREILVLPEPQRSHSLREFWFKVDALEQIAKAATHRDRDRDAR